MGKRAPEHPDASQRANACGIKPVSCLVADLLRSHPHTHPVASKTDPSGTYGEPEVFTEWAVEGVHGSELVVMREHRWPDPDDGSDLYRCEHYVRTDDE